MLYFHLYLAHQADSTLNPKLIKIHIHSAAHYFRTAHEIINFEFLSEPRRNENSRKARMETLLVYDR